MVYFIQMGDDGPIKIGFTEITAETRMASLQTSTPMKLQILGTIPRVGIQTERVLHKRFSHLRVRGEWFQPEWELLEYIREYAIPPNPNAVPVTEQWEILMEQAMPLEDLEA